LLAVTPPDPYSDASRADPTTGTTAARSVTASMRQLAAVALLAGNAVLLFLGVSNLLLVVTNWIGQFGARSEAVFDTFAGPVAIALPLLSMLIATHVSPPLPQARLILLSALVEYAVSAFFGVLTYLGAFAEGVFSVRSTFNDLLGRAVWLAFLTIAITAVYRVYRAMYPPALRPSYSYGPTVYGRPYPGQPTYPRPGGYTPPPTGSEATPTGVSEPTVRMPGPSSETTRLSPPVPAPSAEPDTASLPTPPPPPPSQPPQR
jgi:hypothetical protein